GLGLRAGFVPPGAMPMMQMARTRSGTFGAASVGGAAPPAPRSPARPSQVPPKAKDAEKKSLFRRALEVVEKTEAAPPARLRGKVVQRKGRELIVQIEATEDLDWTPPSHATVEDDAGASAQAGVDAARTTGEAHVTAGQTIRLVLILADDL